MYLPENDRERRMARKMFHRRFVWWYSYPWEWVDWRALQAGKGVFATTACVFISTALLIWLHTTHSLWQAYALSFQVGVGAVLGGGFVALIAPAFGSLSKKLEGAVQVLAGLLAAVGILAAIVWALLTLGVILALLNGSAGVFQ